MKQHLLFVPLMMKCVVCLSVSSTGKPVITSLDRNQREELSLGKIQSLPKLFLLN